LKRRLIVLAFFFVVSKTPTSTAVAGAPRSLNQANYMAFMADFLSDGNWYCAATVYKQATSGWCYSRATGETKTATQENLEEVD